METHLKTLAEELGNALKERRWKLVTAESCTGGGLSYCLTSIPGSSLANRRSRRKVSLRLGGCLQEWLC